MDEAVGKHILTEKIKRKALELGFARVGVTTADDIDGYEDAVLARTGYDDLWQVHEPDSRLLKMAHVRKVVPEAKSIISLVRAVGSIDFPANLLQHVGRIYLGRCYVPPEDTAVTDLIGQRVHGCDACQEACPRNAAVLAAPKTKNPYLEWLSSEFSLEKLLFCDEDYYDACVRPIMFNYIHDIDIFRQNAAVAMGNSGDASYLPALRRALEEGSEQVRRFAKHAIEQLSAQPSTAP